MPAFKVVRSIYDVTRASDGFKLFVKRRHSAARYSAVLATLLRSNDVHQLGHIRRRDQQIAYSANFLPKRPNRRLARNRKWSSISRSERTRCSTSLTYHGLVKLASNATS